VKIVWTTLARRRADEAALYIAEESSQRRALQWLSGLFTAVGRLAEFPNSGHPVPEMPGSDMQQLVYSKSYRVFFRVVDQTVRVLTIRHTRRQFDPGEVE